MHTSVSPPRGAALPKNFTKPVKTHRSVSAVAGFSRFASVVFPLLAALLLWQSTPVREAVAEGLARCTATVIPALFPFMLLSALLIRSGSADCLGRPLRPAMRALFGLPGNCAIPLLLGCVAGYPIGARTVASLYQDGGCSREEAERLLAFCNNTGPAFLIAGVGDSLWGNRAAGLRLYAAQLAAALFCGWLFTPRAARSAAAKSSSAPASPRFSAADLAQIIPESTISLLSVCGFVTAFTLLCRPLHALPLSGVFAQALRTLLCGALEVTAASSAASGGGLYAELAAAAAVGWSGLSVHLQTEAIARPAGLRLGRYYAAKGAQALLCPLFYLLMCNFF